MKLIWGQASMLHRSYRKNAKRAKTENVELYDLKTDPGETRNIADKLTHTVETLKKFAMSKYKELVPPKVGLQSMFIVSIYCTTAFILVMIPSLEELDSLAGAGQSKAPYARLVKVVGMGVPWPP